MPWRRPPPQVALAILLLLTAGTLAGGYLLKAHCNDVPWNGPQYDFWDWPLGACYSDIAPLYGARHLEDGATPYLDRASGDVEDRTQHPGFLEYPLLTGVVLWAAGRLSTASALGWEGTVAFLRWNALILGLFALGTTWLLWRMAPHPRRVLVFALAPPLYLYAFHNWDLVAVFFLVFAVARFEADRPAQCGALLALGASSKLFPLAAAPILFLVLWRRTHGARPLGPVALWSSLRSARGAWLLALGLAGTLVALHIPLFLAGGGPLYLEMFRFHAERTPNFESIWFAVHQVVSSAPEAHAIDDPAPWPTVLLVTLYAAAALWAWLRNIDVRTATFVALFPLLLTNVFFSVQYVLWLVPFFVLLRLPWWSYVLFVAGDVAVGGTLFPYFAELSRGQGADFTRTAWAIVFREVVFLVLVALAVLRVERRTDTAPAPPPAAAV